LGGHHFSMQSTTERTVAMLTPDSQPNASVAEFQAD